MFVSHWVSGSYTSWGAPWGAPTASAYASYLQYFLYVPVQMSLFLRKPDV